MNMPEFGRVLRLSQLDFSYPGRRVFGGFCADFYLGLTWLQGANGSGKSTLLKLIPPFSPALWLSGYYLSCA